MAAELGSPNAQTYFDQVRKRAYQVDDNGTVSANYQAKSCLLYTSLRLFSYKN